MQNTYKSYQIISYYINKNMCPAGLISDLG